MIRVRAGAKRNTRSVVGRWLRKFVLCSAAVSKKSILGFVICVLFVSKSNADSSIRLYFGDVPESTVHLYKYFSRTTSLNVIGKVESNETPNSETSKLKIQRDESYKTVTGTAGPDDRFDLNRKLNRFDYLMVDFNQEKYRLPHSLENLVGSELVGKSNKKGCVSISRVVGGNLTDDEKRDFIVETNNELTARCTDQVVELAVDEQFSRSEQVVVPISKTELMTAEMEVVYTLTSISSGIAQFDVATEFKFGNNNLDSIIGIGSGFMSYDYDLGMQTKEELTWTVKTERADAYGSTITKTIANSKFLQFRED
ncbi:MAG: hypothetical protein AAF434_11725 [Pseudomonadota bacterium]